MHGRTGQGTQSLQELMEGDRLHDVSARPAWEDRPRATTGELCGAHKEHEGAWVLAGGLLELPLEGAVRPVGVVGGVAPVPPDLDIAQRWRHKQRLAAQQRLDGRVDVEALRSACSSSSALHSC